MKQTKRIDSMLKQTKRIDSMDSEEKFQRHYQEIAMQDGFDLPAFPSKVTWKQAAEDSRCCTQLISRDGLYMELLD